MTDHAALPLLRQQIAEEIAQAIEAKVQREWGTDLEEWHDHGMRFSARIAREIGAKP